MAGSLEGKRNTALSVRPAEPNRPPPKKPDSPVSDQLLGRLGQDSPQGGPRYQPVEQKRQRQLDSIVQNSPMSSNSWVADSVNRSSLPRTPPNRLPPPIPTESKSLAIQPLARSMTDHEVLKSIELSLQTDRSNPDFKKSQLDRLITQLASRPFVLEKMPTKELSRLFVALHEFQDERLEGLRGGVGIALAERMGAMALNAPVAETATRAAVRAAFVDRLSSLKENVEALCLLAKNIDKLPREDQQKLTATILQPLSKTIEKLVEVMLHGTDDKSPRIISEAVELARHAHASLHKLDRRPLPICRSS